MTNNYYVSQVTVPEGIGLHHFDKDIRQMILTDLHSTYDEKVSVHVSTHRVNWKCDYKLGFTNGLALGLSLGTILATIIFLLPI